MEQDLERRLAALERRFDYLFTVTRGIDSATSGWDGDCLTVRDLTVLGVQKIPNTDFGFMALRQVTLADDATLALETILPSKNGTVHVMASSSGAVYGSVAIGGATNTVTEISDPLTKIAQADTDTFLCFIADGDGTYTMKNRLGASTVFTLLFVGA